MSGMSSLLVCSVYCDRFGTDYNSGYSLQLLPCGTESVQESMVQLTKEVTLSTSSEC